VEIPLLCLLPSSQKTLLASLLLSDSWTDLLAKQFYDVSWATGQKRRAFTSVTN